VTAPPHCLPNLVVIGGAKTGTTSLHAYLALHPEIFMSREKELRFFSHRHQEGLAWYARHFRKGRDHAVRGETSPQYTGYPRIVGVPERMHAVIPDAKLVYVVRDPFARLLSHFVFQSSEAERVSLEAALVPFETNPYVARSRQAWQLEQYLAYFPLERILVITAEDLRDRRRATLAEVFRFVGVDAFDSPDFDAEPARIGLPLRNRALRLFSRPVAPPRMSPALEGRLRELFAADTDRLRRLTGLRLDRWSV
jgi:hypothetical protein